MTVESVDLESGQKEDQPESESIPQIPKTYNFDDIIGVEEEG